MCLTMIPSGYDTIFTPIMGLNIFWRRTLYPSMRTRLQTPTHWLPSSPCMSLHCPSSVQGHVSHDRFFICPVHFRAALIHTAHLLYCRATAISITQTLEDQMAVRLMHFSLFPPLHKLSGVFFQEREPARTPSMLTGGKHTDRYDNKCARWVTILL